MRPWDIEQVMLELVEINEQVRAGLLDDYPEDFRTRLNEVLTRGPETLNLYADQIQTYERFIEMNKESIRQIQKRNESYEKRAKKMREDLAQLITNAFGGTVQTSRRTFFVRTGGTLVIR